MFQNGVSAVGAYSALQTATILVAMASGKNYLATKILAKVANWRPTD